MFQFGIHVITGSMFSGKTGELVRLVRQVRYTGQKAQVFKTIYCQADDVEQLVSHDGDTFTATIIQDASEIWKHLDIKSAVVAIDNCHFLGENILAIAEEFAKNRRVIIAGLDMDFRGEPYTTMALLMAIADSINKLRAICRVCGDPAVFSQRLIDGKPASYDAPARVVAVSDECQARCRVHYDRPKK